MRYCLLVVVSLLSFPALAAITVSSSSPLSEVVFASAPGAQTEPAVASNGTDFLAVWTDYRAFSPTVNSDVFATRVRADGTILDPRGIALPATFVPDEKPAVIWNGAVYLVAIAAPRFGFGINAIEVRADGTTGATRQLVAGEVTTPALAWNGSAYLVAWSEANTGIVKARLFDRALHAVSDVVTLGNGAAPSAASNGSGFLVAWSDRTVFREKYALLTATGAIDVPPADLGQGAEATSAAFNGVDYAVAWTRSKVSVARVSRSGIVRTVEVNTADGENTGPPKIVWNGTRYLVVWNESGTVPLSIAGAELDTELNVVGGPSLIVTRAQPSLRSAAIAASDARSLILWSDASAPNGEVDIDGALVTRIARAPAFLVSRGEPGQWPQDVVAAGAIYGAVWLESWGVLKMGRLDASGRPLDGGGRTIAENVVEAKIAASGDTFAVVYRAGLGTSLQSWAVRLTREGVPIEQPFLLSEGVSFATPVVAGNADGFMVSWSDQDVWTASLPRSGRRGDARVIVPRPAAGQTVAPHALAWTGARFALLTETRRSFTCGSRPCGFATTLDLHLLDDIPRTIPVTATAGDVSLAELASDGSGLAAMWLDGGTVVVRKYESLEMPAAPPVVVRRSAVDADLVWIDGRYVVLTDEREGEQGWIGRIYVTGIEEESPSASFESARIERREALVAVATPAGGALVLHSRTIARNPEAHPEGAVRGFVRFLDRLRRRVAR